MVLVDFFFFIINIQSERNEIAAVLQDNVHQFFFFLSFFFDSN